jgi:hypothetical protein
VGFSDYSTSVTGRLNSYTLADFAPPAISLISAVYSCRFIAICTWIYGVQSFKSFQVHAHANICREFSKNFKITHKIFLSYLRGH